MLGPPKEYVRKKCAKCNAYATEDKNLVFHRFPLPGKYGMERSWAWANYCYPDQDWPPEKLQELHFQHKMICSKHFDKSCYTTGSKKRLNVFAVPSDPKAPRAPSDPNDRSDVPDSTEHDCDISFDNSHLEMKNSTELTLRSNTNTGLDSPQPSCSTQKRETEMDFGESSVASTSTGFPTKEPNKRVTAEQASILCDFFEENPEIVKGYSRSPKSFEGVQNKWKKVTPLLNAVGPPRDHRSWGKYLIDMKAKLKRKSFKWKQSNDGKDPLMYNAEDCNEITLRMIQVLQKETSNAHDSQDSSNTSEWETENDSSYHDSINESHNYDMEISPEEIPDIKPKLELVEQNDEVITHDNSPPDLQELQPHQLPFEDEFHHFGRNVAEQLRTLPLSVALETQEMLLAVLKKQRLKIQGISDPLNNNQLM